MAGPTDTGAGFSETLAGNSLAATPPLSASLLGATQLGAARTVSPDARIAVEALRRVGRFAVLREVGRGAMGVVYAGYDEELDRRVAIKLVALGDRSDPSLGRTHLLREAQALARLTHPNVVTVFEAGVHRDQVFVVMEYVEGVDLQRWMSAELRGWREVVATFLQAGEGLHAAHKVGLVHRDFKPSNVLVGEDGRVRVADFGLAAHRDGAGGPPGTSVSGDMYGASASRTRSQELAATIAGAGALVGTPAYMAPEQFRHEAATAASDQYAFSAALFEALYGHLPFAGETLAELIEQVLCGELPATPPDPAVPAWLHALVLRGLARDPAARFPDMAALLAELARDPELERRRRRQRRVQIVAAVALTLLVVIGGAAVYRAVVRGAHERRATARLEALREQLATLQAEGRADEAARAFASFVALEDNRGTAALGRAYREWGEAQTDHAAAIDAFAAAYVHARREDDLRAALRGLALRLAARGDADGAAVALATLDAQAPARPADPELDALRLTAALERRDLAAALATLARRDPADPRRAAVPVLEHLSHATETRIADLPRVQRYTTHKPLLLGDPDGDGRPEVFAPAPGRGPDVVQVLRGDPTLAKIAEVRVPTLVRPDGLAVAPTLQTGPWALPASFGGPPRLLVEAANPGGEPRAQRIYAVLPLTPGAAPEHVWTDSPTTSVVGDLDRDGAPELYLGTGAYSRHLTRLRRDPGGAWLRDSPHPRTDATESDINAVAVGDLDGDGAPELVAAVGAWKAYELRVFRADARGGLELVARKTLGSVASLALVRADGRVQLAAIKRDEYPSAPRFPAGRHFGPQAGLYLLELVGGALEQRAFFPSRPGEEWLIAEAADLDGDARDEVVVTGMSDVVVFPRGPEGLLDPLRIAGGPALLVGDLDGDPAAELVVPIADDRFLVLGAGEAATPALPRSLPTARAVREDLDDPAIAEVWRHAEDLAAIGLVRRAADELVATSGLSRHVREDMLLRAGELYAAAGDHAAAAEQFAAAADRRDLAAKALAGAIRGRRALREFAAAAALAEARAALPGLPSAARAEAEAEAAALRRAAAVRPELPLRFDRPLDPAWRIADPLALTRDPGSRDLTLRTSTERVLAELPLEWDGGSVALTADLTLDHLDWAAGLEIAIGPPDDDAPWLCVALHAGGSSSRPDRRAFVAWGRETESAALNEILPAGFAGRVRLHLRHDVELGVGYAEVDAEGAPRQRANLPDPGLPPMAAPPPGPLRLRLVSRIENPVLVGRVQVHAIDLVGFRPGAPLADAGDDAETARLIVEGELSAALARLDGVTDGPRALWRVDLLARLGRDDEAVALLRELQRGFVEFTLAEIQTNAPDETPQRARFRQLVMHDPDAFLRVARRAVGPALDDVLGASLLFDARQRPAVVRHRLVDLDTRPLEPPATREPHATRRHGLALFMRGATWRDAGRLDLARRDFEAAWRVLDDDTREFPDRDELRRRVGEKLLELALHARDAEAARRWLDVQRRDSKMPEITLEIWRERPGLVELVGADAWAELAGQVDR